MNAPQTQKLPHDRFNTEWLDVRDRWAIWRETTSVLFDTPAPPADAPPLAVSIESFFPGSIAFTETRATPQNYERSRQKIARDGMDHYLVALYLDGGAQAVIGDKEVRVRKGDLCFLDLAQSVSTRHTACRTISMFVPRAALDSVLPASSELHGSVLPGESGLGMMLSDQFVSLRRRLPDITMAEGPQVADALVELVGACFRPTAETLNLAGPQVATALLDLVKRHIEQHLSTEVSPESIAAAFRMSRATLYRLFEPLGGVSSYIQERRLARAYAALIHPAHRHRPIYDIAFDCGFASEAHFSRAFRLFFGLPPSELRALGTAANHLPPGEREEQIMKMGGFAERMARFEWWEWARLTRSGPAPYREPALASS